MLVAESGATNSGTLLVFRNLVFSKSNTNENVQNELKKHPREGLYPEMNDVCCSLAGTIPGSWVAAALNICSI